MRTLKKIAESNKELAEQMISKKDMRIEVARNNMDVNNINDEYFENKAIVSVESEERNYWVGIKTMASIVLDYANKYIENEERELEELEIFKPNNYETYYG
ncbi:Uncharacterised protein [uncultured Clostridium sp.]|nr:Uncharacterised protein [uncultured Clostridium sp.]SCI96048.1 Uncharacterised protein [uncultured Clostridium sp.]